MPPFRAPRGPPRGVAIDRREHPALRVRPRVGLEDAAVEALRTRDREVEDLRAILRSDLEQIAEAARDDERTATPFRSSRAFVAIVVPIRTSHGGMTASGASPSSRRIPIRGARSDDRTLTARMEPSSGERPRQSVKVPPRSIQICHRSDRIRPRQDPPDPASPRVAATSCTSMVPREPSSESLTGTGSARATGCHHASMCRASRARGREAPKSTSRSSWHGKACSPGEVLRVLELALAEVLVAEIVAPDAVEDAGRAGAGAAIDDRRDTGTAVAVHGAAPGSRGTRRARPRRRRALDALAVSPRALAQIDLLTPAAKLALARRIAARPFLETARGPLAGAPPEHEIHQTHRRHAHFMV